MSLLGLLAVASTFFSGAVPYGLLIARARGVDLRQVGSGNIGATNAARALGKRYGLLILALDVLKGLVPVLLWGQWLAAEPQGELWLAGAMVAGVLGHMFTPFLLFRGGKGVATGLGVILAVSPLAGLIGLVLYVGLYALFRLSSLGSLAGTLCAPLVLYLSGAPRPQLWATLAIGLLIVVKHRANIRRLLSGSETRV